MQSQKFIHPSKYFGSEIQKIEFEKIFSNNWIFAAMESDLTENNSYLTLEIFEYPIVIRNFKGELKAFQNICPHRFNKIHTETKGNGIFICKYHNWSFDKDGKPKTIPQKHTFDTNCKEFNCLKVKSLSLAKVGKFIFITLNPNAPTIESYLGIFYFKLLEISSAINNNFYFDDDVQNINWKIVVENLVYVQC